MADPALEVQPPENPTSERLDSWKEIAAYLNRDVTTVQRWEKREGMPVHRHLHDKRGSVYAMASELDVWRGSRKAGATEAEWSPEPVQTDKVPAGKRMPKLRGWLIAAGLILAALVVAAYFGFLKPRKDAAQPRIKSLAVLPLRNLSGDNSQDYLADGMTEALIGRLAGLNDLRVVSHTSVMRFKGTQLAIPEIAKSLGVDAVMEGSVLRDGSRIRVTAQLIRGQTDEHFWSETYDRELRDALSLESELAQAIAEKVEATVTGQERQRLLAAARPVAPEVYESYLKGRYALGAANDPAEVERALGHFEHAIELDPGFAPAYIGVAASYNGLNTVFMGGKPDSVRMKAANAIRKALAIDPNLSEAHDLLAGSLEDDWHWSEAASEYQQALDLNHNDANAHFGYALWLLSHGRTDEALSWAKRAREIDPVTVSGSDVAWILFQSRRYEEAEQELRSALEVRPEDSGALWFLGFVLIAKDDSQAAISALERAAKLSKRSPGVLGVLIRAYAHAGRRDDALRLLAELKERHKGGYVPAAAFVNAYLGLGDKEQAFIWLEKGYQEKSNILQWVKTHPYFDPIRSDPRFVDLVHRVGLS